MTLDEHFNTKQEGCVVKARICILRNERIGDRVAEAQHANKDTIMPLTDVQEHHLLEPEQICEAFQQHFARLFRTSCRSERSLDFSVYLYSLPRLSTREAGSYERRITAANVRNAMSSYTGKVTRPVTRPGCSALRALLSYARLVWRRLYRHLLQLAVKHEYFRFYELRCSGTAKERSIAKFNPINLLSEKFED